MRIAYVLDRYPALTETFVSGEIEQLRELGHEVHVEAIAQAWVHETRGQRRRAAARLAARRPVRCLRDLAARRRWRREEDVQPLRWLAPAAERIAAFEPDHIHVHFAAGAALEAMRIGALLGVPYSVMTHGHDIFAAPANLAEKHRRAAFAVTACEYSRSSLGDDVHVLVMGVDGAVFRRNRPYPDSRTVIAVGRLVEKKGFRHLAAAAEGLDARVVIVGEGPERDALEGTAVELLGERSHAEVRELMQDAALLAMPCVIAADGDRDTMPVVVKEALALGIPVVASDAVGLPEVVRPAWGRLVPPGDAHALRAAIGELLALRPEVRAAMGAAGRAHVLEHCSLRGQAERLATLISANSQAAPRR